MGRGGLQTMQYATSSRCCATETRSYNSRGQLKELSSLMPGSGTGTPPRLDLQYIYNAGSNNGQIAQMNDMVSGEQTVYTYDSLKRLVQAQASVSLWGQSFGYDGFGNLISKTPTAGHTGTGMSLSVDPSTNRVTSSGFGYDANGNTTSFPTTSGSVSLSYDVENRTGGTWFDIANRPLDRVDGWSLYGLHGARLETVALGSYFDWGYAGYGTYVEGAVGETFQTSHNIYFGSRLIQSKGTTVATDRLGSVRLDENGGQYEYYPYGEMFAGALTSGDLFATYTRESATGLDYANQRYYSSVYGRFATPDPYKANGGPSSPSSWNRYSYTRGDPVNRIDPSGLLDCGPGDPSCYCNDDGCCTGDGCYCTDDASGCGGDGGGGGGGGPAPPAPSPAPPIPTSVVFVGATRARINYAAACPNEPYGAFSEETFEILNQYGQPFAVGGLPVQETLSNWMVTTSLGVFQNPAGNGVSPANMANIPTSPGGTFLDSPFGACGTIPQLDTFDQQYSVLYNGVWYPLGSAFFISMQTGYGYLSVLSTSFGYTVSRSPTPIPPGLRGAPAPPPHKGPKPL